MDDLVASMAIRHALGSTGGGDGGRSSSSSRGIRLGTLTVLRKQHQKLRSVHKVTKLKGRLLKLRIAIRSGQIMGSVTECRQWARHVKLCFNALEALEQKTSVSALCDAMASDFKPLLKVRDGTQTSRMASKALAAGFGKLYYKLTQQE